jgi:large subunit ribosomal protein L29
MTSSMKSKDVRRRASGDLREEIKRLEKAVFDHRFRGQSEEKSDRGLVRRSRRDVARILTVLRERELAGTDSSPASSTAPAAGKKE